MGSRRWRIVGIVEDMRQSGLDQEPGPEVFVPVRQLAVPAAPELSVSPFFIVRTAVTPASAVPGIRAAIARYDPQLSLDRVATMEEIFSNTLVRPKFFTTLLGVFAGVAVSSRSPASTGSSRSWSGRGAARSASACRSARHVPASSARLP